MQSIIPGVSVAEYNERQKAALARLRMVGEAARAQEWIRKHRPPHDWRGTPLEYAENEMPVGIVGSVLRFIGLW